MKLVTRLTNRTSAVRLSTAGWMAFVQPDGSRSKTTLHTPDYRIKHTNRFIQLRAGHWVAAENPDSGWVIIAVSPKTELFGLDWGGEGAHVGQLDRVKVPPEGAVELVGYLALAPDLAAAKALIPLKNLA